MNNTSNQSAKKIAAIVGLLIIVAAIGVGALVSTKRSDPAAAASATTVMTTTPAPSTAATNSASVYKNGTYQTTISYSSPGGQESLGVSLTIANDTVTGSQLTNMAGDHNAKDYQDAFIASYQSQVVGKPLADINLSRVSGSSLTSRGFNAAVAAIKSKAKA